MPEERLIEYLDGIDGGSWTPEGGDEHAPSHDEWNARRLSAGLLAETFEEYIAAIKSGQKWNHAQSGNRGQVAA